MPHGAVIINECILGRALAVQEERKESDGDGQDFSLMIVPKYGIIIAFLSNPGTIGMNV